MGLYTCLCYAGLTFSLSFVNPWWFRLEFWLVCSFVCLYSFGSVLLLQYMASRSKVQQQHLLCRSSGQRFELLANSPDSKCAVLKANRPHRAPSTPWAKASACECQHWHQERTTSKGLKIYPFVLKIHYPKLKISRTSRYLVGLQLETEK